MAIFPTLAILFFGFTTTGLPSFGDKYLPEPYKNIICRYEVPYEGRHCRKRKEIRVMLVPTATMFESPNRKIYWNSKDHPNYIYNEWCYHVLYFDGDEGDGKKCDDIYKKFNAKS